MNDMSNFCEFITQDNISFECVNCGMKIQATETQDSMPIFICSKPHVRKEQQEISFAEKIKNFAKATSDHIRNGMPMCTEQEILDRHDICLKCEYFKDDTCTKCGCPLVRTKQFISKLAWADQECPVGKWGRIAK